MNLQSLADKIDALSAHLQEALKPKNERPRLISVESAAQLSNISFQTLQLLIQEGKIRSYAIENCIRICPNELIEDIKTIQ